MALSGLCSHCGIAMGYNLPAYGGDINPAMQGKGEEMKYRVTESSEGFFVAEGSNPVTPPQFLSETDAYFIAHALELRDNADYREIKIEFSKIDDGVTSFYVQFDQETCRTFWHGAYCPDLEKISLGFNIRVTDGERKNIEQLVKSAYYLMEEDY